ncbi:MAG: phosphoribosylaminoimidazolesuccinocarboxamide synthase [Dehalococcoidales bacterium]|jgi:phosphoribosylaminoimidazole-succinocarboxamide synthase|nr:phosphoribosylaminoimidazolesuccinocarboxamide synthase [Dehalococcoidales bacterium]
MTTESPVLLDSDLSVPVFIRGKVRDTYQLGDRLLIIATDRVSVFDVVLPNGIPDKGKVLNQISAFWFEKTVHIIPNHLIEVIYDTAALDAYLPPDVRFSYPDYLSGRSMVVRKAERIDIEWVVRGYITGSAWEEYAKSGTIQGMPAPAGLLESQELPEPMFTPTTKAESGHDMPMSMDEVEAILGQARTSEMKEKSLAVYTLASEYAREKGLIIADTKMEFGLVDGQLILIDELLTPDSSRFWGIDTYRIGQSQPSYDKQPVRDWTARTGWNKQPPAPELTPEVIEATTRRYREACEKLTGQAPV